MTFATPADLSIKASRRFMGDVRGLPGAIVNKVANAVDQLRQHGAYYPGLETRKIAGNPDGRFRLMDVDYSYRMVAALEGRHVFLEKVGLHDETERWGETATLDPYAERMRISAEAIRGSVLRPSRLETESMFEEGPSLAQIAESEAVSEILTDCLPGILEGWNDGTIEDWMVLLSPIQRRAVDRAVSGPSRVTGGPGTGKTVVGLHRAKAFAEGLPGDGRILITSFVNTVPKVLDGLFERLAPDVAHRAEFRTVHSLGWAAIGEMSSRVDDKTAKRRFNKCLRADPARYRQLRHGAKFTDDYLWEEVTRVIIGRGVDTADQYRALPRVGRKRPMPSVTRSLVWDIYQEYLDACKEGDGVMDWNLMLRVALEQVRQQGAPQHYAAIVVDEAQDITEVGVRLVLEHLEGGPGGRLMLVGDSGQRIYPGGYRLSDLGLETRGRSFALDVCYRSTDEIMRAVGALGQFLSTEEFGDDGLRSVSASTVRSGPRPVLRSFTRKQDEVAWIIDQLDPNDPSIDSTGILGATNAAVKHWRDVLGIAGLGTVGLDEYVGRPVPGVKVGTYNRAKGLEFERLFLPSLDDEFPYASGDDDALMEAGSLLYVGMSRARDRLLLSYSGRPSMFLESIQDFCDVQRSSDGRPDGLGR